MCTYSGAGGLEGGARGEAIRLKREQESEDNQTSERLDQLDYKLGQMFSRLSNPTQQLPKQTVYFSTPCQGYSEGTKTSVSGTLPVTMTA